MPRTTSTRHINELLITLNDLLSVLDVSSEPLETITDLKPALLISILEAILQVPLSELDLSFGSTNQSTSLVDDEEDLLNLHRTKLFLGVLETDVLEVDVGLSNIDPRRLAQGKEEELLLVAELLCWVGKRHNIIPSTSRTKVSSNSVPQSPTSSSIRRSPLSPTTTAVTATVVCHSPYHRPSESLTSIDAIVTSSPIPRRKPRIKSPSRDHNHLSESFSPPLALSPPPLPIPPRIAKETSNQNSRAHSPVDQVKSPRVPSSPPPSVLPHFTSPPSTPKRSSRNQASRLTSPTKSPSSPTKPDGPVRYDGWISPVDEELELLSFESSRQHISLDGAMLGSPRSNVSNSSNRKGRNTESLKDLEAARRTNLQLLQERARLLEELAKFGIQE